MNQLNFKKSRTGKFYIVPASKWSYLKTVIPGTTGKAQHDRWIENDLIRQVRKVGGIFVNDHFIPLWDITRGLLFLDGGYGSSKTTYVITRLLVKAMENDYFRCFYGRQKKTEARNLLSNIITEIKRNGWGQGIDQSGFFDYSEKPNGTTQIVCTLNGNRFEMFGCDDDESLKGIDNPTDILVDEINQLSFSSFGMLFTRLRGMGYETQLMGCFNNCDVYKGHWLKKYIYGDENPTEEAEIVLYEALKDLGITKHHSNYLHNLFQNPDEYYRKLVVKAAGDPVKIKAFAMGEWGISLNAQPFYKAFNAKRDTGECIIEGYADYNPNLPLHISWDENRNPYLPLTIAQISGTNLYIIDEIAAENPYNTLSWVCNKVVQDYYYERNHRAGMFIYGDATSKKGDTKLEQGANFFTLAAEYLDIFKPTLRVSDANPNVAMRGNFLNAIFRINYEKITILINSRCVNMIDDLQNCPESPDGKGKDKSKSMVNGVRGVQKYGHFSDTLDYLVCEVFMMQFLLFQSGGHTYDVVGGGRIVKNSVDKVIKIEKSETEIKQWQPNRIYEVGEKMSHKGINYICYSRYKPGYTLEESFEGDWDLSIDDFEISFGSRRTRRNGY